MSYPELFGGDDESEIITVVDDEGVEHEFELFTMLEVDGKEYAVLFPLDEDESIEDSVAFILRLEKDADGEDTLVDIEDNEEWKRVEAAWEAMIDEDDEDDE